MVSENFAKGVMERWGFGYGRLHDDIDRTVVHAGAPVYLTSSPSAIWHRAPRLGEHDAEVFGELRRR